MNPGLRRSKNPATAGFFLAALLGALLLGGCAISPQWDALDQRWPADIPRAHEITQVPFFPQDDYECGPAALAMASQVAGAKVLPDDLTAQVYLPGRKGSLQTEMKATGRRQGLLSYQLAPTLEALLREVAAGHPVIVLQNLSLSMSYPVWHYAVVIGYDLPRARLLLHSGRTERMTMFMPTFERTWALGRYWAMVVLPPGTLPATATAEAHATEVAALERVAPAAARVAYARGLQNWPEHRASLLGAGNAAYAMRDLPAAAAAYTAATQKHPDFADAWNNLAHVLYEQKDWAAAQAAVARAVALGGPRLARYQALEAQIRAAAP